MTISHSSLPADSYCVIMAGGIGNRFWPVSNTQCPKQFSDILHTGKSFIRQTYERISRILPDERIFVITGAEYEEITHQQIPELPSGNILKEPLRRNTATCIMYAAEKIKKIAGTATMVVVPSDHFITNDNAYWEDLRDGIEFVRKNGGLLTFGITPSRIETQYGYIQVRTAEPGKKITAVKTFTEKPDYELAQKFYESGDFLWNAGIFIWQVEDILREIRTHLYDLYSLFENNTSLNTPAEEEFINTIYGQCPNVSIDFGILEKSNQVYVLRGSFGWSDVGTWHAFQALCKQDENNNTSNSSQVIFHNSHNCLVNIPEGKIAIIYGVDDLIIAAKDNYLMICHSKDEEKIRNFEKQLKFKK